MSSNMLDLLRKIRIDNGLVVNNLIKSGVITKDFVVKTAIYSDILSVIYDTAKYIKELDDININKLADKLIEKGNIKYIRDFACNVNNAPIDKLMEITISKGTAEHIYEFAKKVPLAKTNKLALAIIDKKDCEYIYKFIKEIPGAPRDILIDALIDIKEDWFLIQIAKEIKDNDKEKDKILNAIIGFNDGKSIYNYSRIVDDANIDMLSNEIIKTGNSKYIYKFASDIPGASLEKLAKAVIKLKDPEYIYYFARIKGAPLEILADAIIETRELTYIELFMHIDGAPTDKLLAFKNKIIGENFDEEKFKYLLYLASNNYIETIKSSIDVYRSLFKTDSEKKDGIGKIRVLKTSSNYKNK